MTTGNIAGQRSNYRTTTVYIPAQKPGDQDVYYMINVDDPQKAAAFAAKYGSQIDPNTNWFSVNSEIYEYLDVNDDFRFFDLNDQQIFQLADVLSNYDAGMSIYKVLGDNTSEGYGVSRESGNTYLTPTKCK